MSRAVFIRSHGGPEVLSLEEREVGLPGRGEIRIRNHAIGLNFIDTYHRSGLYKLDLPFVGGNEGAGEVTAVGEGVELWTVGDRVAYSGPPGAYADERLLPADKAVAVPDGISYEIAAAALLKGTTAFYLIHWTHAVQPGDTVLVHAAAGGTGQILCQWASAKGARVIGTAGSAEKLEIALANGCAAAINYREDDFVAQVRELTGGRGVDVVYDGVGQATFEPSLDCLRPRGLMVSFGNASGPVSIPNLGILASKGSLYVTRPTSGAYFPTGKELREGAGALFAAILAGDVRMSIEQRFPLTDIRQAHEALESRATSGQTVLLP
jgi:NADPH2:quinone reductase